MRSALHPTGNGFTGNSIPRVSQSNNNYFVIITLGFFFFLLIFLPDEAFSSFLPMILPDTYCSLLLDRFFTQACSLCLLTLLIAGNY